jgi:HKD family nuclease
MAVRFIGQGLDTGSDINAGNLINESLLSIDYQSADIFVAFVSTSGLKNIIDELIAFRAAGGTIRLYVGVNLNATSMEALENLIASGIETYVIYSPNSIIYHPKVYLFRGAQICRAIIGSSNLTASGLFQNVEASICYDFENGNSEGEAFLDGFFAQFDSIVNNSNGSCKILTQEVLDILIENKVVLPEAVSRAKANKINKEFAPKDTVANKRLHDLFGKLSVKRPPKGFRKTAVQKEFITVIESDEVVIVDQSIELTTDSMWIQSGLMTSPARNILGLSKRGLLANNTYIEGSVSFFGINPITDDQPLQIEVEYAGELYLENQVHYTLPNGSWRLNFYGATASGKIFNDITRPNGDIPGAFQNKILLFTRINPTRYKLEVLENSEIDKLKDLSSIWARNGASQYAFGYIA